MKLIKTGTKKWPNQHQTFTETIKDLYIVANEPALGALDGYNDTTKGLQQIIGDAIKTNTPIKPLGAGWSWTKIATVKDGIMIDTKQLNTTLNISAKSVVPGYNGDVKKLLFAQCGNGIWELNDELRAKGLSLKTCGASNGQTIVGAMSTGAHGSTIDVGGVQDYVVGIHLIVGPDRHIYLERKSAPIVNASFINNLNTTLVQDDDLFNAALVSFGSFGIIHGVMLVTEDRFLLETYRQRMPIDASLKKAMETLDFNAVKLPCGNDRPFHFSVSINPYDLDNGAYVSTFYKRPYREDYVRPVRNTEGIGPGDDAPVFIGKLTDVISKLVPTVVNKLLGGALKPYAKQFGTLGEIFDNTTLHGKLLSTALGFPLNVINRVTDLLLEVNKTDGPFTGLFAYRFIKKTDATLGFTHFPDFTCIVELDGIFSQTTQKFYNAVWKKLDEENIPFTFHWGKMVDLNPARITKMYGAGAASWIAARNKILDAGAMKVFTNPLLQEWGLDKVL
jgi:hypothetical protein